MFRIANYKCQSMFWRTLCPAYSVTIPDISGVYRSNYIGRLPGLVYYQGVHLLTRTIPLPGWTMNLIRTGVFIEFWFHPRVVKPEYDVFLFVWSLYYYYYPKWTRYTVVITPMFCACIPQIRFLQIIFVHPNWNCASRYKMLCILVFMSSLGWFYTVLSTISAAFCYKISQNSSSNQTEFVFRPLGCSNEFVRLLLLLSPLN